MIRQPSIPKPDRHLATFGALLTVPDLGEDLFPSALHISAIEHPDLPPGWPRAYLDRVRGLADEAVAHVGNGAPLERFERLHEFLFQVEKFSGNEKDYGDPRNSALTDVLDRRLGIPITLGVLAMSVGRAAGIPILGVSAPGHFITGMPTDSGIVRFGDPFNKGRCFDRAEARARVRVFAGTLSDAQADRLLQPAPPRQILFRMLNNLKSTYAESGKLARLIQTLDWIILLDPANADEVRNRGLVLLRNGEYQRAVQDLACYADRRPDAKDLDLIRSEVLRAQAHRARNN